MKVYFAGPLFSIAEQEFNNKLSHLLEKDNPKLDIILPQNTCKDITLPSDVFTRCKEGIDESDYVIAILDGADADSGTCWEVGYAYAIGKKVIGIRTDFRTSGDDSYFNCMLSKSCAYLIIDTNLERIVYRVNLILKEWC